MMISELFAVISKQDGIHGAYWDPPGLLLMLVIHSAFIPVEILPATGNYDESLDTAMYLPT